MRRHGLRLALLLLFGFLIAFGVMYKLMDSFIAENVIPSIATARVNIKTKKPEIKEEQAPAAAPAAAAPAAPKEAPKEEIKEEVKEHLYSVLIKKGTFTVTLLDNGKAVKEYRCAVGENAGQKERTGDRKTPTGTFPVNGISDASKWTYDFKDGKGETKGAYGPWFISLDTDGLSGGRWGGIGIAGTHDESIIGKRATGGGVRLKNEDLEDLKKYVKTGTMVTIEE